MEASQHNPLLHRITVVIAEEVGCPSIMEGEAKAFKYCADKGARLQDGSIIDCYCENAARKVLEILKTHNPER